MVHKLPPLHHVVSVQLAGSVHVRHDVDTDQAGRGQGGAGLALSRSEDSVSVLGEEGALEGSVGGAPERIVDIVTRTSPGS